MKILVNKVQVEITKDHHDLDHRLFDTIYDAKKDRDLLDFLNHSSALIIRPTDKLVFKIIDLILQPENSISVENLTFVVFKPKLFKESFKSKYQFQELAGGVVQKGNKFLLILENNKWGFPKGRIDSGEMVNIAAKREVEEEASIIVNVHSKLGSTYKLTSKSGNAMRKYHWFLMESEDRSRLKPSMLEGIKDAKWLTRSEIGRLHDQLEWYVEDVFKKYDKYLLKRMRA